MAWKYQLVIIAILSLFFSENLVLAQLSENFYSESCPQVFSIIQSAVKTAVEREARMGASLLRLHYHDCFVSGCDASVLLDDNATFTGEKTAAPNRNTIRGFEVIDGIKSRLEDVCPGTVSCADILAVVARDSVVALGGMGWPVPLGRRDSKTASLAAANSDLPSSKADLDKLIDNFSNHGFTLKEMVALVGAHTIGQAHCASFRPRVYNDTSIDSSFGAALQRACPASGGGGSLAPLDKVTPDTFDNSYYRNLLSHTGLLHSDQQFFSGGPTDAYVAAYAADPKAFMMDFARAIVKMGSLRPLTGSAGQIRRNCRKVN